MCWRDEFSCWGAESAVLTKRYPDEIVERRKKRPVPVKYQEPVLPKRKTNPRNKRDYELRLWARAVKERDGHACVVCGAGDRLAAHHLISRGRRPDLAFSLENGETRCVTCHRKAHPDLPDILFR